MVAAARSFAEDGAERQAATDGLGEHGDVGKHDRGIELVGEVCPGPGYARLDVVDDQQGVVTVA